MFTGSATHPGDVHLW